jgi:hypothetical protein
MVVKPERSLHITVLTEYKPYKPRPIGSPAPTAAERKEQQAERAEDGRAAMAEYHNDASAALDRMASLRAARLAQVVASKPTKVMRPKK